MLDDLIACFAAIGMFVVMLFVIATVVEFYDTHFR